MKNIVKKILVVTMATVLLANVPYTAFATSTETVPSGIGFDEVGNEIEKWAADNPNEYVSFSTAVFCEDEIIYQGAFGYADRENEILADEETVYEWGSVSKTLVWVSVMQLWEKGQIDLDRDIREYLPENFFRKLKYDEPITMLNLMNHDAGWSENVWAYQTDDENNVMSLEEALRAAEPVQVYRPGEVCSYSNYGAAVAGYVVECITGQSFVDYVHENIFEPLGMEHTSLAPAHDDNPWVYAKRQELVCYANAGSEWVSVGPQLAYIMPYPAGAATGTIGDMAIYAGSLASEDCPLFEQKETRELLFSPSSVLGDTDIGISYHGFWTTSYGDVETIGHDGGTNGCTSYMYFDKETGVGTVVLMTGAGIPVIEIPEIVFGSDVATCPTEMEGNESTGSDISGIYIGARSMRHGPLKIISLLGILPVVATGDGEYDVAGIAQIQNVSGEYFWITQAGQGFSARGYQLEDGTKVFSLGSQSYVEEPALIMNIVLLAFYVMCTVVAAIMLVVKLILVLARKQKKYEGAILIAIAQVAKIVSVGIIVFWISVFSTQYGLTSVQGIVGCLIQMLCFASYLASAGVSGKALINKDIKAKHKVRYVINIIANVLCAVAMISLEFMRFWNV